MVTAGAEAAGVAHLFGLAPDLLLHLLPFHAEGRVGQDHLYALALADLGQAEAQRVARIDVGCLQPVEQQVHLYQQKG